MVADPAPQLTLNTESAPYRPAPGPGSRLNDAVRPFLKAAMQLSATPTSQPPPAEVVYTELKKLLQQALDRAQQLGVRATDLQDIKYALIAFADERMLLPSSAYREFWQSHRLQLEYFGETRSGEGFFERLTAIRSDPGRHAALRAYYLCLLLGFYGMYRQMDELSRENIIEQVRRTLEPQPGGSARRRVLSPHGQRPDEPATDRRRSNLLQWLALGSAALALIIYLGLRLTIDAKAQLVHDRLDVMLLDLGASSPELNR